jgi:hypothetical protein
MIKRPRIKSPLYDKHVFYCNDCVHFKRCSLKECDCIVIKNLRDTCFLKNR